MPDSESRPLTSAFESPTFGEDSSFHVEQPVGSMSISPCGRDVVLASKEGLHVIDLDSPYSPPRYLPHHTPWEVADVQWSPFAARDYWVVSTSNQKALVWNLAMKAWQNSIEHVLHAHTRAITDINFSAHHADIIATCAVDSFVHCWDLRNPLRPAISFSDWFAGATQVKWNRQDPNVIASSHDKFLRIWDKRMGASPIKSIEAHDTKIYGVDWNRVRPGAVVTCSLDKTIKFWDYTVEGEVPEKVIRAPFPVWRARNTPFGWGVLAMPQRGNSDLHLYSRRAGEGANPAEDLPLVHSFPGHKGQVKEFLWRARGGVSDGIDHREFQLVSWGTDRELRLHRVDPDILEAVGYEKGKSFISNLNLTRKGAVYKSFRDDSGSQEYDDFDSLSTFQESESHPSRGLGMKVISPYARGANADSPIGMQGRSNVRADNNPISWMRGVKISGWDIETLGDEITHVGEKFTKVAFESVDVRQRKATISLHGPWAADGTSLFLKVDIKFPVDYPKSAMPTFHVQKTAAVTDQLSDKIIAELRTIAETYLSHKRSCLEGVVRYLLGECDLEESIAWILGETAETVKSPVNGQLEGESSDEDEVGLSQSQELGMSSELLRPVNANVMVPVAKACGMLWANDGRLVCFFPAKKGGSASLLENLGFKEMTRSRADKVFEGFGRLQTNSPGPRVSGALASTDDGTSDYSDDSDAETSSSSGSSASGYRIYGQGTDVCAHNASVALDHGYHELARIWGLVKLILHNTNGTETSMGLSAVEKTRSVQRKDSAVDLSYDTNYQDSGHKEAVSSVIQWGDHPFASHWLIPSLFEHFERIGDVQMVAMLSCVLEESKHQKEPLSQERRGRAGPKKTEDRSFSLDFYTHHGTQNKSQTTTPLASTPKDSHTTPITHSSGRSSSEIWRADSTPPYSTGTTPPLAPRASGLVAERRTMGHNTPVTASPDQQSQPRSASGLGSVLASSLSRSFTFGPSSASPPTSALSKKKQSPNDSPNLLTGGVWTANAFTAKPVSAVPDYLTTSTAVTSRTHSDTESERPERTSKPQVKVHASLKNTGSFESSGGRQNLFLDPRKDGLYRAYRTAYANLLSIWGLPIQRSEVLKVGGVSGHSGDIYLRRWAYNNFQSSHSLTALPCKDSMGSTGDEGHQGLEIQRHCIRYTLHPPHAQFAIRSSGFLSNSPALSAEKSWKECSSPALAAVMSAVSSVIGAGSQQVHRISTLASQMHTAASKNSSSVPPDVAANARSTSSLASCLRRIHRSR
ncbi:hypothetical protein EYZ11_008408 [Aspergillus tanneri]|uniref:RWD domain-containing protein n=1 Tax=Aspergillus tanneri TaxID=1220188 RepID=A0A4S3JAH0_9EURO|nr:hypothetical protein EYZ11_008408 [Aspergillus tanneri]